MKSMPVCISLWKMSELQPCLEINYSSDFSLAIQFSSLERKTSGYPQYQYRFDVTCRVLHFKGEFTYTSRGIFFDPQTFRDFTGQLDAIREGNSKSAKLSELGNMIEFSIEIRGRETHASLKIQEHQLNGERTLFSASFQVEYDLFVNVLHSKATKFVTELAGVGFA